MKYEHVLSIEQDTCWGAKNGEVLECLISPPCSSLYRWGERWSRSCWSMCHVAPWTVTPLPRSTGPHSTSAPSRRHPLDAAWWESGTVNSPLLHTNTWKNTSVSLTVWRIIGRFVTHFFNPCTGSCTRTNTCLLLGLVKRFLQRFIRTQIHYVTLHASWHFFLPFSVYLSGRTHTAASVFDFAYWIFTTDACNPQLETESSMLLGNKLNAALL